MRYFFEIAFNGTHYHGWQIQDNAISIQQVIQEKLALLTKQKNVPITGCGRTDTGVHASQFYFHVDLKEINDLKTKANVEYLISQQEKKRNADERKQSQLKLALLKKYA